MDPAIGHRASGSNTGGRVIVDPTVDSSLAESCLRCAYGLTKDEGYLWSAVRSGCVADPACDDTGENDPGEDNTRC